MRFYVTVSGLPDNILGMVLCLEADSRCYHGSYHRGGSYHGGGSDDTSGRYDRGGGYDGAMNSAVS